MDFNVLIRTWYMMDLGSVAPTRNQEFFQLSKWSCPVSRGLVIDLCIISEEEHPQLTRMCMLMQLFLTFPYYNPNQSVPDSSNSFHISFHHLSVESRALSAAWWHLGPPCTSQGTQLSYIFGAEGKAGRYPFSSLGHPAGYASTPEVEDWWHFRGWKIRQKPNQSFLKIKKTGGKILDFSSKILRVKQLTNGLNLCNAGAPEKGCIESTKATAAGKPHNLETPHRVRPPRVLVPLRL